METAAGAVAGVVAIKSVHVFAPLSKGGAEHELARNTEAGSRPGVILENLLPRRQ